MFRDLADLQADALTEVLVAAGEASGHVSDATVEAIDDAAGFLGTIARVRLKWSGGEGPASVVAKLPTTIPANQDIVDQFGYDQREAGVYRDLRPWTHTSAPRALAQGWDDATSRGWLLLEDLSHLTAGDGVEGATDAQAFAVVAALAQWHAAYWNDDRLGRFRWLPDTRHPAVAGYGMILDMTWDMCVDRLGGVSSEIAEAVALARPWFDRAIEEFASGDRTLVHGDARLDNLRFSSTEAVLLDFQLATHSRGVYDVAFFAAGSLTTNNRRRLEPALLERYRDELAVGGVDVELDELWRDYRLGHMLNLPNPVSAIAVVTPADERGAEFLRRNVERGLNAVADHVSLLG
jgi:aminoglycoside phosphotransferase (APT) family kinase protein